MTVQAKSLHVGINAVNPSNYGGWDGKLRACENDAKSLEAVCSIFGYSTKVLLTGEATAENILDNIYAIAKILNPGDIFIFTTSSHGGLVPDPWGKYGNTPTMISYNRQIISHEFYKAWGMFKSGVRIFMISDSCHSGHLARLDGPPPTMWSDKLCPKEVQEYINEKEVYYIRHVVSQGVPPEPVAGIIQYGACQDDQVAYDGMYNSLFTEKLLRAWQTDGFKNYKELFNIIVSLMPHQQVPNYVELGVVSDSFRESKPFQI
jgi:hypothetical protein